MAELDVAGNIKTIEKIKGELLRGVSDLYIDMLADENFGDKSDRRLDDLSDIIILTYRLAEKLGVSYHTLDYKVTGKLKLNILGDGGFAEASALLAHIGKRN